MDASREDAPISAFEALNALSAGASVRPDKAKHNEQGGQEVPALDLSEKRTAVPLPIGTSEVGELERSKQQAAGALTEIALLLRYGAAPPAKKIANMDTYVAMQRVAERSTLGESRGAVTDRESSFDLSALCVGTTNKSTAAGTVVIAVDTTDKPTGGEDGEETVETAGEGAVEGMNALRKSLGESGDKKRLDHKAEQFFLRKYAADITKDDFNFLRCTPQWLYRSLPEKPVHTYPHHRLLMSFEGPDEKTREDSFADLVCAKSVSSYPRLPHHPKREGDPICDSYKYSVFDTNRVIAVVADGCNWGAGPRSASRAAGKAFVEYLTEHQGSIRTIKDAGHLLLRATSHANTSITRTKSIKAREPGTTTLLGGILVEVVSPPSFDSSVPQERKWNFVCVNVGDCKAFLFRSSTQEVFEINVGSRSDAADATDPGGRLGPFLAENSADLRNLELFHCECQEGDIISLCSDGVFDNLDPKPQGLTPKDFGLSVDGWDDPSLGYHLTEELFALYRLCFLEELIYRHSSDNIQADVKLITHKLLSHALLNTETSRSWMISNPGKRLPKDWIVFPGKMDHTTCLSFRVGRAVDSCSSFETQAPEPVVMEKLQEFASSSDWQPTMDYSIKPELSTFTSSALVEVYIPLSISVCETETTVDVHCHTIQNSSLSCLAEEHRLFLTVKPFEELTFPTEEPSQLFGIDELDQPISRTVLLPHKVLPSTKAMSYDHTTGLVTISFQKKPQETSFSSVISVL